MPFTSRAFRFFRQLKRNNRKPWFEDHREEYEHQVREPMRELIEEMDVRLARIAPEICGDIRRSMFRINRDIRFSADKSPYKTSISAGIRGHYVHLSPDGLYVGAGMYKPEPAVLQRFRAAIADDTSGRALQRIVTALRRKGYDVGTHESVRSAPKGYSADHPRIGFLRMKDIHAGKRFAPDATLSTRKVLDRIRRVMTDLEPFNDWIKRHVH